MGFVGIKRLEQYGAMVKEVEQLEIRIKKLRSTIKTICVSDTTVGSSHSKPYAKRVIAITGLREIMSETTAKKIEETEIRLIERRSALANEIAEIEAFIDGISDSDVRRIIQYKYIDRLTWAAAATKIYGHPCGDRARKRMKKFFQQF